MKYNPLGSSSLKVSEICLGTMTWGVQNNQQDADEQIAYALSQGINFFDTAEMYAIPPTKDTYGTTETIIGNWLQRNPEKRQDIILASKIAGGGVPWIRDASPISGDSVKRAVDASLKRLQTDYIDVYQLHWPNRTSPHFSKHWPGRVQFSAADPAREIEQMHEILQSLGDCIQAGKLRYCGLSDDTTWGISQYINLSNKFSLPAMVSIQNEFSLLHIKDWPYLIEHCIMENIAYLPWSPLGAGILSGKYLNGQIPQGSRWSFSQRNGIFRDQPGVHQATQAFAEVAEKHQMTLPSLALAWCKQVDGVTSTIIGATTMEQLKEDVAAFEVTLSQEALDDTHAVLQHYMAPF
ncbi:MAG: aldo/keto reductase [Cellvibrionaceae bacterium]|nr:aldo/keto reductase [Cellvibrionaceae bacterium]